MMVGMTETQGDLVGFRIEIPNERLVSIPTSVSLRLSELIARRPAQDGGIILRHDDFPRDVTVAEGRLPRRIVTILQALAMGHDYDSLLEAAEADHP